MVGTESKKEHNELVEEILRRIEENDLYVKLEKCRWKVREVEFLGVECKKTCFSNPTLLSRLVEFSISYSTPLPKPIASVPLILSLILLLKPIVFVFITLLFSAATLQV